MKRTLYIFAAAAMIAAGATSCLDDSRVKPNQKDDKGQEGTEMVEIDGIDADHGYKAPYTYTDYVYEPEDSTTYSVASYRRNYFNAATPPTGDYNRDRSRYYYVRPAGSTLEPPYAQYSRLLDEYNKPYDWHLDPPGWPQYSGSPYNDRDNSKGFGRYAYIKNPAYRGILQPAIVDETVWKGDYKFISRNPQYGQGLLDRDYRTVFWHPAIKLTSIPEPNASTRGEQRVLFARTQEVLASEPFDMTVKGYGIFILPDTSAHLTIQDRRIKIHDIRSKIMVKIIRDANLHSDFTITEPRLKDVGYWGWYHPLMKYTDISYYDKTSAPGKVGDPGYPRDSTWVYIGKGWSIHPYVTSIPAGSPTGSFSEHIDDTSMEWLLISQDPNDWVAHNSTPKAPHDFDLYDTGNHTRGATYYTTGEDLNDGFFIFANDYLTGNYKVPALLLNLNMGDVRNPNAPKDSIATFRMNIPLTMKFKPGYQYRFTLQVTSTVIRVTFNVIPWFDIPWGDPELGIAAPEVLLGTWYVKDWIDEHDGSIDDDHLGMLRRN